MFLILSLIFHIPRALADLSFRYDTFECIVSTEVHRNSSSHPSNLPLLPRSPYTDHRTTFDIATSKHLDHQEPPLVYQTNSPIGPFYLAFLFEGRIATSPACPFSQLLGGLVRQMNGPKST